MLAAPAVLALSWLFVVIYNFTYLDYLIYQDREKTIADYCDNKPCVTNSWPMHIYPLVLLGAMPLSLMWGKKWRGRSTVDYPAAVRMRPPIDLPLPQFECLPFFVLTHLAL